MQALEQFLAGCLRVLKPGGRLAVITYHSLEDRMVKNFMRTGNVEGREERDFFGAVSRPAESAFVEAYCAWRGGNRAKSAFAQCKTARGPQASRQRMK